MSFVIHRAQDNGIVTLHDPLDRDHALPPPICGTVTLVSTVALFCGPIVFDLVVEPRRVFGYLAPDAFYYLTVARNHWETGVWSFDGQHKTNGYHPLWQWILSPIYGLLTKAGAGDTILLTVVLVNVALIATALLILGRALASAGRLSPLYVLVVPGVVALLSTPLYRPQSDGDVRPIFTTLWSYANGMETALLLLLFSACVRWYVRQPEFISNGEAFCLGLLLLLLTFARLDHVFFALSVAAAVLLRTSRCGRPELLQRAASAFSALTVGILFYIVVNQWVYDVPIPISGVHKASFPRISGDALSSLWSLLSDPQGHWLGATARLAQLLVPMLCALMYLMLNVRVTLVLRPNRGCIEVLLCWVALAVLALGAYNVMFVRLIHMGTWYFPLSALFVSLAVITTVDRTGMMRRIWASSKTAMITLALLVAVCSVYFFRAHYHPEYMQEQASFYYDEAPRIRAYYGEHRPKLVEFDDGIVTFATGFPAMSGFGMLLDSEALDAKRNYRLMRTAVERGYDRIVSSYYVRIRNSGPLETGHAYGAYYGLIDVKEFYEIVFVPEYFSPESGVAVFRAVRLTPEAIAKRRSQTRTAPIGE